MTPHEEDRSSEAAGLTAAQLTNITGAVFDTMASIIPEPVTERSEAPDGATIFTGLVHIVGDWQGTIMVEMTDALALAATAAMLGLSHGEVEDEDTIDVVGELTNMIAGNVNNRLGSTGRISAPSVMEGSDYKIKVLGNDQLYQLPFVADGEPLCVSLLRRG